MISPTHGVNRFPTVTLLEDPDSRTDIGSVTAPFTVADSTTLLIGDFVYIAATGVTKSATAGNYTGTRIGIVVGGDSFNAGNGKDQVIFNSALIGSTAGTAGQRVWVAIGGAAWAIANGTLNTIGTRVIAGGTSGRVAAGTTAGGVIGITLTTAANAADPVKILIQPQ